MKYKNNFLLQLGLTISFSLFSYASFDIPEIASEYVHIYNPQPDVYTLKDTANYKSGETYQTWQANDHSFIQGPDGRWHCFGITRPDDVLGDGGSHEAGGLKFHALAPQGTLEDAFLPEVWLDQPKFRSGGAPYVFRTEDTFHYINSADEHLTSSDLYEWVQQKNLAVKRNNKETRDPDVLFWNDTYYLIRCDERAVSVATSKDLDTWSDPVDIFVAPKESWHCESPSMVHHNGMFYLFWCLWDSSPDRDQLLALYKDHEPWAYDYRTFVYASEDPMNFHNREPVTMVKGHAPEIFQDEKGNWFISSADYPRRGINLARLKWNKSE